MKPFPLPNTRRAWQIPLLLLAAVLAGCGGAGDGAAAPPASMATAAQPSKIEPYERRADTEPPALKKRAAAARLTGPRIQLGPLVLPRAAPTQRPAPRQIGAGRASPQTARISEVAALLAWQALPNGGRAAALSFVSPEAVGIRLGMLVRGLPGTAVVRAYGPASELAWELPGREVLATLDRNAQAGDRSDAGRTYWLPLVPGEEATLEIELPPGMAPAAVEIAVPQISHVYESPLSARSASTKAIGDSGSCEIDIMCSSDFQQESRSVAKMEFISGGDAFLCTGTLLADSRASGTPYFLSAHHCISTQLEASTLATYWFFRSASCGSTQLDPASTSRGGGATLLYASSSTDVSFMQLHSMPPATVVYAGSWTEPPLPNDGLVGVHHPQGDLQKISRGYLHSYADCSSPQSCSPGRSSGNFLTLRWTQGTTEGGSSGSAVWRTISGRHYVVGQLMSGAASCSNLSGFDFYGRFDLAYNAALHQWLNPPPGTGRTPIYRFYNATTGAHFYTSSMAERDDVVNNNRHFFYEGTAFFAYGAAGAGLSTVYRFYALSAGSHFYTISELERQAVQGNPGYRFEGPSWFATTAAGGEALPIYRFYNPARATHFYTISETEKEFLRANDPNWSFEGIAYYGWPR